jgi:hypothetical protein
MPLYSSAYLRQLSESKSYATQQKLLLESKREHTTFDIFLSHSYLDKKDVEGIYIELTNEGYSVYVDWIVDPLLDRTNVTKQTAELIRARMKASKTLLLAISTNAQMSKWMPWELGFVDGKTNKCAIFPVSNEVVSPRVFKRSEYLLLYPYIKRAAIGISEELFITESSNSYVSVESWIRRNLSPEYRSINIDNL